LNGLALRRPEGKAGLQNPQGRPKVLGMSKPNIIIEAQGVLTTVPHPLAVLGIELTAVDPDIRYAEPLKKSAEAVVNVIGIFVSVGIATAPAILRAWRQRFPKEPKVVLYGPDNKKIDDF
jgi:hypothetical protein